MLTPDDGWLRRPQFLDGRGASEFNPVILWDGRAEVVVSVRMSIHPWIGALLDDWIRELHIFGPDRPRKNREEYEYA